MCLAADDLKRRPHSTQSIVCLHGGESSLDNRLLHLCLVARAIRHTFDGTRTVAYSSLTECKGNMVIKLTNNAPEGVHACVLSSICGRAAVPFSFCAD